MSTKRKPRGNCFKEGILWQRERERGEGLHDRGRIFRRRALINMFGNFGIHYLGSRTGCIHLNQGGGDTDREGN